MQIWFIKNEELRSLFVSNLLKKKKVAQIDLEAVKAFKSHLYTFDFWFEEVR